MGHHHHHGEENNQRALGISIALNFLITAVETAGGLLSGSLSLLSDALHNFSDALALIISLIALRLGARENSEEKTFGYKRAEIIAAFINSLALILISVFLFKEAFGRFAHPVEIKTGLMLAVASIGLAANAASAFMLKSGAEENMNMRAAYLHLFSDALSSVGVILGALCIRYFGLPWVDPLLTIIIGAYVLYEGYQIAADTLKVLMQYAPAGLDVRDIEKDINALDGVKDLHHLHVWTLSEHDIHLEAHINMAADLRLSDCCLFKEKVEHLLHERYDINHATIQFEYNSCGGEGLIKRK
jgi:cobalt-zinc-cadmium efflux system protein